MTSAFASYGMRVAAARSMKTGSGLLARLQTALNAFAARRAARELSMLDDHLLRDIGIHRGQIDHAVRFGRR